MGHQNRIGSAFVGSIRISEHPEEYGGYCEANHCRIRADNLASRSRTFEIVRGHSLFKMSAFEIALGCAANERSQLSTRR